MNSIYREIYKYLLIKTTSRPICTLYKVGSYYMKVAPTHGDKSSLGSVQFHSPCHEIYAEEQKSEMQKYWK